MVRGLTFHSAFDLAQAAARRCWRGVSGMCVTGFVWAIEWCKSNVGSGADDGVAEGDDSAVSGGVEDLDKGDEEGIEAGEEAKIAAEFPCAIAEIACGEEEEGDPEEEEDAEDGFAGAEGDDPEQEGEDAPQEEDRGDSGGGCRLEPSGADGPLQEGKPLPEKAVGGEGNHAEGVARAELEDAGDDLGDASVGESEGNHHGHGPHAGACPR